MSTDDELERIFPVHWLENQILPRGYHIVNSVSGKLKRRPPRHETSAAANKFNWWKACCNPSDHINPSLYEGYGELSLIVTSGLAEIYIPKKQSDDAQRVQEQRTDNNLEASTYNGTPPIFPIIRAYINDKPIWQTQVGRLKTKMDTNQYETATGDHDNVERINSNLGESHATDEWGGANSNEFAKHLSTEGKGLSMHLLDAVYSIEFDDEVKASIYTPASLLTLHIIEKDFCEDMSLSESLLASTTIPLYLLQPNKTLDLMLSVNVNMPSTYSLESMLDQQNDSLKVESPILVALKLFVSVTVSISEPFALSELAALALPRGEWTPKALPDPVLVDTELLTITACDIFSLCDIKTPLTPTSLIYFIGSLIFALGTGFDDVGNDNVMRELKKHVSSGDMQKNIIENSITIFLYLVVGPRERIHEWGSRLKNHTTPTSKTEEGGTRWLDIMSGELNTVMCLCFVWIPVLIPLRENVKYFIRVLLFALAYHVLFDLKIAIKPMKTTAQDIKSTGGLLPSIESIQSLAKPVIEGLSPGLNKRLRIFDLWIQALATRCIITAGGSEQACGMVARNSFYARPDLQTSKASNNVQLGSALMWALRAVGYKYLLCMIICSNITLARRITGIGCAVFISLYLLRHVPYVNGIRTIALGIPRYFVLVKNRNTYTFEE